MTRGGRVNDCAFILTRRLLIHAFFSLPSTLIGLLIVASLFFFFFFFPDLFMRIEPTQLTIQVSPPLFFLFSFAEFEIILAYLPNN